MSTQTKSVTQELAAINLSERCFMANASACFPKLNRGDLKINVVLSHKYWGYFAFVECLGPSGVSPVVVTFGKSGIW